MNYIEHVLLLLFMSPFIYLAFRNMYLADKMRAWVWNDATKGEIKDES